jgi:hypothetical protein
MRNMQLGRTVRVLAPIDEERTERWRAGPITLAIEQRELRTEIDRHVWHEAADDAYDDSGITIHVLDTETGREYLRFDCFAEDPHYHYNWPGQDEDLNQVVVYDTHAHGADMFAWAMGVLRGRVGAVLANSGGAHLVERLDGQAIERALDEMERAGGTLRLARQGRGRSRDGDASDAEATSSVAGS